MSDVVHDVAYVSVSTAFKWVYEVELLILGLHLNVFLQTPENCPRVHFYVDPVERLGLLDF